MSKAIQGWHRTRPGIYLHESGARVWSNTNPEQAGNQPLQWSARRTDGTVSTGHFEMCRAMHYAQLLDR